MNTIDKTARQGDVMLVRVDKLPIGLIPTKRDAHARIVLALGESSGHGHAIRDRNVRALRLSTTREDPSGVSGGVDYIEVGGSSSAEAQLRRRVAVLEAAASVTAEADRMEIGGEDLEISTEDAAKINAMLLDSLRNFATAALAADPDSVLLSHEYVSGKLADHLPIITPPGLYKIELQQEYTPEAIVRVAD